jgi:hypothetical protein
MPEVYLETRCRIGFPHQISLRGVAEGMPEKANLFEGTPLQRF